MTRRSFKNGPILQYSELFRTYLLNEGYKYDSTNNLVGVWKSLNYWMYLKKINFKELEVSNLEAFIKYRIHTGYANWKSIRSLNPLILFLAKTFNIRINLSNKVGNTKLDQLICKYKMYLEVGSKNNHRVKFEISEINKFIKTYFRDYKQFRRIKIKVLRNYLVKKLNSKKPATVRAIAGIFRKYFRWCFVNRIIFNSLHQDIPKISSVGSRIPRSVPLEKIKKILKACDKRTANGRKNFAVITLMSELGLRMCEVANLKIEDVDWKHGQIKINAKNKESILPLSESVGHVLVDYLKRDRPKIALRNLFILAEAPYRGITSSSIQGSLGRICKKAGVERITGHQLRHTVATQMLKNGSSLYEISQVLRHSNIATTAIYAKVDSQSLMQVVRPWPGSKK